MTSEANVGALHGNLLTALGTAIVSGEYPPGAVLTLDGVSAHHGVSRSVATPKMRELLASQGLEIVASSPAEFTTRVDREIIKWRKVILEAGIKLE